MKIYSLMLMLIFVFVAGIMGCALSNKPESPLSTPVSEDTMNEPLVKLNDRTIEEPVEEPVEEPMDEDYEMPSHLSSPKIIIKKADRKLELWDGDRLIQSYPIGLGFRPIGHKALEGDGRTPEGSYYVCTRNAESKYYKSLGVSYPNKDDAKVALDAEIIEAFTYESIAKSVDRETKPPWDTPMGGQIMIHGHGSHEDWTEGCVAVDDDVMDILWDYCPIGTPIFIYP
ncbi:MAG TPA: L,D-transpeptidase family protein [Clostridia bacterium]|nr:L,D-transpeptidase family protein [Clostridia bacterium]